MNNKVEINIWYNNILTDILNTMSNNGNNSNISLSYH